MALRRRSGRKSKKSQSEVFQGMGAAWENETKKGDLLISLKVDIEDFEAWLDAIKFDDLPEETKLSIILLEQTKSKKRGAPDFVIYGLDPTLPEGDEPEPEPEPEKKTRRRRVKKEEEPEEKPKRRTRKAAAKVEEDDKELDLDFEEKE